MSQESLAGKGGRDKSGGVSPSAKRRRWPIWSEPHPRLTIPCNICGFSQGHSSVCPFGPMP